MIQELLSQELPKTENEAKEYLESLPRETKLVNVYTYATVKLKEFMLKHNELKQVAFVSDAIVKAIEERDKKDV
jgi:hypothetical protein